MLSIYLMVATVMVLNLLVALFATTYEDVMVRNGVIYGVTTNFILGKIWKYLEIKSIRSGAGILGEDST